MIDDMKIFLCKWEVFTYNNYQLVAGNTSLVLAEDEGEAYGKMFKHLEERWDADKFRCEVNEVQEAIV